MKFSTALLALASVASFVSAAPQGLADAEDNRLAPRWGKAWREKHRQDKWRKKKPSKTWHKTKTVTKVIVYYKPTTIVEKKTYTKTRYHHGKTIIEPTTVTNYNTTTLVQTSTTTSVATITNPAITLNNTITATATVTNNSTIVQTVFSTLPAPTGASRLWQQTQSGTNAASYAINLNGVYSVNGTAGTLFNSAPFSTEGNGTQSNSITRVDGFSTPVVDGPCFYITDPTYAASGAQNSGSAEDQCYVGYDKSKTVGTSSAAGPNFYVLAPYCATRGYTFNANVDPLVFCNIAGTTRNTNTASTGKYNQLDVYTSEDAAIGKTTTPASLFINPSTGGFIVGIGQSNTAGYAAVSNAAPAGYILDASFF